MATADPTGTPGGFALDAQRPTVLSALKASLYRPGDLGALPAIAGLLALFVLFGLAADRFMTKGNFANLLTQSTWVILLAVGVMFVLLLGEIDLSAGYTAGVCVVTMAWLMAQHGVTAWLAIPIGFVIGALIGVLTGWLVAWVGIPSFVVTLSFFLSWQGVVLLIAKEGGTISISNDVIIAIVNRNIPPALGWGMWALVVVAFLAAGLWRRATRERAGLPGDPVAAIAIKTVGVAAVWGIATYFLNQNRAAPNATKALEGVPVAVAVVLAVVVLLGFLLDRTSWGRHVYAVGGNIEAARRAGINVRWIKMSCFMMLGVVACLAGMALGSQLNSVSPQTGGNDTLLRAVGAAAIGGVSLFGGKGKILYPVVGGLVVATIDNGLGLMGKVGPVDFTQSGPKFIVQGLVLLLAAGVDAVSRRGSTGR